MNTIGIDNNLDRPRIRKLLLIGLIASVMTGIGDFLIGFGKFWILPGCEDIPYVQTWKQMLKKRGILTLIWVVGAAVVAGIVVLIF